MSDKLEDLHCVHLTIFIKLLLLALNTASCIRRMGRPHKVARLAVIPDHLIVNAILPRLPVKSLLRFKSVCKDWCSVIASPAFAKSHLAFSGSRHQFLVLQQYVVVDNPNYRLFRAGIEYDGRCVRLSIAGSCHGLVCFYFKTPSTVIFFVLNPATGQRVQILAPDDKDFKETLYWFGYVSSVDDYKIAAFNPWDCAFWSFSWKAGIWKRIPIYLNRADNCPYTLRYGQPALVNDTLYWPLTIYSFGCWTAGTDIVEINLVSEKWEVKPRMHVAYQGGIVDLFNVKGHLALHTTSCMGCLDVWILRQNDDWGSWEKFYSKVDEDVSVVCFSATGKLFVNHLRQLKVVDNLCQLPPEEEDEENIEQGKILQYFLALNKVEDYVESLISPFRI
ncbi:hypothetical protein KSS87_003348 [Heliosperma pusillum]|nr:hypothetical protein KSS87_003348 [Heliosperma pusillum]